MPIFDVLSPKENSAFSEILQKGQENIVQDLEVLLSQPVTVSRLSMDYNPPSVIKSNYKEAFLYIKSKWEGDVSGSAGTLVRASDAKAMCGFLMMEQAATIRETMGTPLSEEDMETFREIANQINGSFDNGLRKSFKFDFHVTLEDVSIVDFADENFDVGKVFDAEGYIYCRTNLKLSEFSESFMLQIFPLDLIKSLSELHFQEIEAEEQQREKGSLRTVLLVDNDEVSRKILKNHLKETDFVIVDAPNGMDALGTLRKQKVDLVVMEVDMPSMNGIQVCHRMKSNPNTRKIPIVFCSANSTQETITNAIRGGGMDFLVKPVAKELLTERISKIVARLA